MNERIHIGRVYSRLWHYFWGQRNNIGGKTFQSSEVAVTEFSEAYHMNLAFSNLLGYSDISIGPTKFHSRQTPTCFVQNFPFELHIIIRTSLTRILFLFVSTVHTYSSSCIFVSVIFACCFIFFYILKLCILFCYFLYRLCVVLREIQSKNVLFWRDCNL